jgi:endonuclease YncB( thermonuclease family)
MTDDRPDIKRKAIAARDHLRQRLVTAEEILLKNVARDKYFRVLADIWVDGISIQRELIAKGLAKPYDGGTKSSW